MTQVHTDKTSAIIENWKLRNPDKIVVLNNKVNLGYAASCNVGFHNSRIHPYVLTINADDIQVRTRFSKLLRCIESTNVDIVMHDCEIIDNYGNRTGRRKGFDFHKIVQRNVFAEQLKRNHFWNGLVLFKNREDLYVDHNLPVSEDYDLFLRLFYHGATFTYIDEPLLLYRVHGTNMSLKYNISEDIFKKIFDKYAMADLEKKIAGSYDYEGEIFVSLAQVCLYRRNWEEALQYLNRGLSLSNNPEEVNVELLFMLGYTYYKLGLYEQSWNVYTKLNQFSVNPTIINNLGVLDFLLFKNKRRSLSLFERAVQLEPLYGDAKKILK